ncbi:MAG: WD40 repeat domain-containing protein, partial [Nostoc sp.]
LMKEADEKVHGYLEKNSRISDRHLCGSIGKLEQTKKIITGETTPVPTPSSPDQQAEVKLLDPKAAKEISELKGHQGPVRSVAFSPDGQTL